MRKKICILILFALIGIASAAVYVTFNPEARLLFDRPSPGPYVLPVQSFVQIESGEWTNSYEYGTMTGDILEVNMLHKNGNVSTFNGVVYFEIDCAQGLGDNINGSEGIRDFATINYTDPVGNIVSCNNDAMITRLSNYKIRIIPTMDTYPFEYGVDVPTFLMIEFVEMAYGDYVLWVFVDEPGAL